LFSSFFRHHFLAVEENQGQKGQNLPETEPERLFFLLKELPWLLWRTLGLNKAWR